MNMDSISDLLEIAGEDDSLLSDHGSTSANIFSCSPLVSIRSRPLQTTQPAEGIEITSVVSEDLTSKCSKPEAPESQQKKRKKKFGGFNLRKSLAWDRAFFTEQGVLNPTELSMISGTATPNSKSNLEVIDEEELGTTSIALQKIEENLFKHSSGGVSIREEKIGAVSGLTPKSGASVKRTPPIASLGKRKVLATNNVGNKYKGSAIPRAVPSSSLKRIDTAKMPSKESKITRIPGPKSNVSANATTTRSGMLSSGSSKRNQIARPSLSKNPTPSITSQSKNPMPSIPRLSKNPTPSISSQSKNPTYVPSIPKVDMADKCSVSRTLTKQAGKLSDTPVSILRPQSRMDQTMHQTGTIKSSGLRKPSPSIGFFSQVKASSLQTSSIPCKPSESNIPKLRKLETVPVKEARSKIVKGAAKSRTKELSLSDVKSEVQIDNKQMAGVEVDCDSSTFEIINKQAEVENILDDAILKSKEQGELHENEIISSMENMVLPTHEKEFLTESQTHEQLEKEADHTLVKESDTKEFSLSDFKPEAIVQIDNKQMAGVEVDCDSSTFEISKQAEVENILDDAILKSKEQEELHENEIISSMENMVLPTHEKEFLTKSHTHEQLEKEADHTLEKESDTKELSLSDVKPEAIMQIDNKQMAGVEVDCDSSIFEIISKQAEVESLLDDAILKSKEQGELHENEIISSPENIVLSTHEKEFLTKNQTHEQLEKEADHTLEKESDHTLEKESDTKELSLSDVTPEAIMQIDNKQMAGVEVDCNSSIFEIISKKADVENILDDVVLKFKEQGELHENEIISSMENMVLPTHEKEFLTKSPTHEQLEKEADHTLDNKLYDVSSNGDRFLYQEPQSTFFPIIKRTSNTVQNAIGHEDDQIKRATGDIPTFKESLILQAEFSGEFKGYNSVKTALLNSSLDDFSKTVPKGSKQGTPCKNTEQVNYDADEFGRYEGNAQGHLLNESLTINCKKTTESNLEAVSQQLQADQPKTLNPSGVEKIGPGKENISDMNSSQPVHVTSLFSKGSPEKSILGINDASEDESKIIEIKDCQLPVYGLLGFIPRSPVDKECDQVIDSKAIHDKIPEFELNRLSENCITVSASSLADDNNINEDSRLPGFQKPSAVVAVNSQDVHLDSDFLPIVIVSSTEINDQNLVENAFEGYGFHSNEHNATNHHHIEDMPVNINGSHDVDRKVELLQINDVEDGNLDVDEKAELLQINDVEDGNHNVDEKVELLQINGEDDGNHGMGEKVALLQINGAEDGNHDVDEKGELLQINGAEDGNRAVDEKVELLQINDVEDGNHDVDEKVELLQINGAEDGNCDVDEKMELLQINDVDEKVELLQINDVDEMVELLQINYVEDGNHDVDEKVELLQINGAEDGNHDVEEKVELLQINDAEEGLSDILLPLVESQLNENFFSAECDSSIEVTGDFFTTAVTLKYEKQCILSENSKLLSSDRLVNKDGNQGVDEKVELLQINGAEEGSLDISPSVEIPLENVISAEFDSSTKVSEDPCPLSEKSKLLASENSIFNATIPQGSEVSSMKLNENAISAELDSSIEVSEGSCLLSEKLKLLASENSIFNATIPQGSEVSSVKLNRNAISTELDSSIEVSEGPFTSVVAWKPEEQCLISEKSKLLDSDNPIFIETIPQGNEVSSVNSEILSDAAVTTVFENDKSPNTDMPSKSKDNIDFPEDNSKIIHFEIDATKTKQEVPIAKPPLNVAPFTEEWLAAIEAAGEEILTMKSGAVQNSPPDKVQNEPNPWSPVKKNQEIGPFDCTKITKHNIQSSDPS